MGSMKFEAPKGTITFNLSPSNIKFDPALLFVSPVEPYRITIDCDGDTTTAKMIVNGKTVKTATAKRNPADKANWRIGAQTAFDRLWKKQEKKRKGGFEIGDLVVDKYTQEHGRVVCHGKNINGEDLIGVEMDSENPIGHECKRLSLDGKPHAKKGFGMWYSCDHLRREKPGKQKFIKPYTKLGAK